MIKIMIGIVLATIAVIGTFLVLDPNVSIIGTGNITEVNDKNTLKVSVEGAVYKQGTYTLNEGATMGDLIEAAGGVDSSADLRAFYEDATVVSGMTYFIASRYDATDLCNNTEIAKVNINIDSADTMSTVNGISLSIANSIITYRTENGMFSTIEQIQEVYGVGAATYKKIRNSIILHE